MANGNEPSGVESSPGIQTHLIPDQRLLHRRQRLQRRQQEVRVLRAADVLVEPPAKLLREREENLVLIIARLLQKGDELLARTIGPKRERDGRHAVDGVQAKLDVLRPQLVHEERYRSNLRWGDVGSGGVGSGAREYGPPQMHIENPCLCKLGSVRKEESDRGQNRHARVTERRVLSR